MIRWAPKIISAARLALQVAVHMWRAIPATGEVSEPLFARFWPWVHPTDFSILIHLFGPWIFVLRHQPNATISHLGLWGNHAVEQRMEHAQSHGHWPLVIGHRAPVFHPQLALSNSSLKKSLQKQTLQFPRRLVLCPARAS